MSVSMERTATHAKLLHDWMTAHADARGIVTGSLFGVATDIGLTEGNVWRAMLALREQGAVRNLSNGNGRTPARWRLLDARMPAGWGTVVRYTDERIERARAMWDVEGKTSAEIGAALGMSRNSVISMAHRHGFAPRPSPITGEVRERKPRPPQRRVPASTPVPVPVLKTPCSLSRISEQPVAPPVPPPEPPLPEVPISAARTCQFPLWNDRERPTHRYCGRPALLGQSWCAACRKRVFTRGWGAAA